MVNGNYKVWHAFFVSNFYSHSKRSWIHFRRSDDSLFKIADHIWWNAAALAVLISLVVVPGLHPKRPLSFLSLDYYGLIVSNKDIASATEDGKTCWCCCHRLDHNHHQWQYRNSWNTGQTVTVATPLFQVVPCFTRIQWNNGKQMLLQCLILYINKLVCVPVSKMIHYQ